MGWGLGDVDAEGLEVGDCEGDATGFELVVGVGKDCAGGLSVGDGVGDWDVDGLEVG